MLDALRADLVESLTAEMGPRMARAAVFGPIPPLSPEDAAAYYRPMNVREVPADKPATCPHVPRQAGLNGGELWPCADPFCPASDGAEYVEVPRPDGKLLRFTRLRWIDPVGEPRYRWEPATVLSRPRPGEEQS